MMNKKGIAILKTIILITLIALFSVLIIYVMEYIKDKNKEPKKDIIKMVTPTEYNPVNDIYSFYLYSYKNSNFTSNSTYETNVYNYETNTNVYYYAMSPNGETITNISSGNYPIPQIINTRNNNLLVGQDLNTARTIASYMYDWNGVRSWSIGYNCNIPIESFNFTMYYNFPLSSTTTTYLYIYTDVGSVRRYFNFTSTNKIATFSYTTILSTLPNATKILRFGFAIAASSSINSSNYLPVNVSGNTYLSGVTADHIERGTNPYTNYYNTLDTTQKENLCYLAFSTSTYPIDYTDGYNDGYNDALNNANNQINQLSATINDLQNSVNSMTQTIETQNITIQSLQSQLDNTNTNFKSFFFTIADTPIRTISNCLGFEVFGINLFQFFIGVLTALGCIWLIKKFL